MESIRIVELWILKILAVIGFATIGSILGVCFYCYFSQETVDEALMIVDAE
jgi:hypothetical protein